MKKFARPAPLLLHPLVIATTVWFSIGILYSLRYSKMLLYDPQQVFRTVIIITLPFAAVSIAFPILRSAFGIDRFAQRTDSLTKLMRFERRLNLLFRIWICLSIVEVIAARGVPIVWVFTNPNRSYGDYGIPSVHGFVNSLIFTVGTAHALLYLVNKKKRNLWLATFALCWSIIVISRSMTLVFLLQYAVLFLRIRAVKLTTLFKVAAGLVAFIFLFGEIGELRQRNTGEDFTKLAQPSPRYPDFLPKTLLWGYIYAASPLNNLLFSEEVKRPEYSFTFPNTAAQLLPSPARKLLYGQKTDEALQGSLVVETFNASTAYVSPWQDMGYYGIAGMSFFAAIACNLYWYRRDLRGVLFFSFVTMSLVLTLFSNNYFALPVLTQMIWFLVLTMPPVVFTTPVLKYFNYSATESSLRAKVQTGSAR